MSRSSSPYLYRIQSFDRVVQLLQRNEMYFARPSTWEDPFERVLNHRNTGGLFAQCWFKHGVSDAMWRIYSPNSLGVRIRTTRDRLRQTLRSVEGNGVRTKVKDVAYRTEAELDYEISAIADALAEKFNFEDSVAALFYKRNAFKHEDEVRAVVSVPSQTVDPLDAGYFVKVQASWLIESILIDPRAPREFVEAYRHYLKEKLQFAGTVQQSGLYAPREAYEVD